MKPDVWYKWDVFQTKTSVEHEPIQVNVQSVISIGAIII